jgi:hypothetical protein
MTGWKHSYLGILEKYQAIRTDRPLYEIWSRLLQLTDINYLSLGWKDRAAEEYLYVSTSITQAHEYYTAGRTVSLKTKPLLMYYSFLNLTKAILYILEDKKPIEFHGLSKPELGKTILDYSTKVNDGVFLSLAKYLQSNIKVGDILTLEDFILNAIELTYSYADYFRKPSKVIEPEVEVYSDGDIYLIFKGNILKSIPNLLDKLRTNTEILSDFDVIEDDQELKLKNKISIDSEKMGNVLISSWYYLKH